MIVDVNALRGPLLRELAIGPKANTAGKKKKYGPVMHFWSAAEGKRWRPWGTTARNRSFKGILRPPSMAARARHGPREANSSGLGRSPSAPLKALYRSLPANISIHRIDRPFIWPSSGRFLCFFVWFVSSSSSSKWNRRLSNFPTTGDPPARDDVITIPIGPGRQPPPRPCYFNE